MYPFGVVAYIGSDQGSFTYHLCQRVSKYHVDEQLSTIQLNANGTHGGGFDIQEILTPDHALVNVVPAEFQFAHAANL